MLTGKKASDLPHGTAPRLPQVSSTRRSWCIGLLLVATTLAVYAPAGKHDFVNYDDPEYVAENPHITSGLTFGNAVWAFTSTHSATWHPLTGLSHMLDCQLFGLHAGGHHLMSVLLHAANAALLFAILNQMTGMLWRSAVVAALFALHPLHVESVAWASERKDVLSTLFWMLTIWAYAGYVRRPHGTRYALALALYALALLSKPMVVTLPFVLLLLDYWPLRRLQLTAASARRLAVEKLPFFALAAAVSAVTFAVQRGVGAVASMASFPVAQRIENALVVYVTYLVKMFWPSGLAVFYPYRAPLPAWQVVGAAIILLVASILALRAAPRRPYVAVGWLWYLGMLVPVIGIVRVGEQAMADRFTYVPLVGIFILLAWGASDLTAGWRHRAPALAAAAVALIAACTGATWMQLQYWRNTTTLLHHALAVTTDNYLAHTNLGAVLVDQGRLDEAARHFSEALRIKPNYARPHANLGMIVGAKGHPESAVAEYETALRLDPNEPTAHYNLGLSLANQGKLDEAVAHYTAALRANPIYAKAHNNLGWALAQQGKLDEAVAHYTAALRIKPDLAAAHNNLAVALEGLGDIAAAMPHYREVVRLAPDDPRAHYNLGAALAGQGRAEQAEQQYAHALRLAESSGQTQLAQDIRERLRARSDTRR